MNLSHENGHAKRFSFSMFIVFCLFLEKILQHLGSLWTTKNLGEGLSQMIHPLKAYFCASLSLAAQINDSFEGDFCK